MKTPFLSLASLTLASLLLVPVRVNAQGSLAPSGAPAPVMKTLAQIEPRTPISALPVTITNSGSYYLTTNLTITSATGVTIITNDVTLDLNGFTLRGDNSSYGISVNGSSTNITVRDGVLRQWSVALYAGFANNCRFEHLQLAQNGLGIYGGDGTLVSECLAVTNTQIGIQVGYGGKVLNCISRLNVTGGISAGAGCSVIGCVTEYNGGDGIVLDRGIVRDCTARMNTGNGINVFINCRVENNLCNDNKLSGINLGIGGHRIEGNAVNNNAYGLGTTASTGNLIIHNSATANGTNYNLSAINTTGPIVTSGTIATDTHPHANFSF